MNPKLPFPVASFASAFFAACFVGSLQAATISNPSLVTSGNMIAPSAAVNVVAANATAEATIEAVSGLSVLQDFSSFSGASNIVSFTSASRPDISISGSSGNAVTNSSFLTSTGSALRIQTSATGSAYTQSVTIDFGTYDSSVFDGSNIGVAAAAFTLNSTPTYVDATAQITATFYGVNNQVLSTQTFTPVGSASNSRIYFGYESVTSSAISSIQIDIMSTATGAALIYGLDDLAFTGASSIPEPSTASLLIGAGALGVAMMMRRTSR
jgi:hypothetical protein